MVQQRRIPTPELDRSSTLGDFVGLRNPIEKNTPRSPKPDKWNRYRLKFPELRLRQLQNHPLRLLSVDPRVSHRYYKTFNRCLRKDDREGAAKCLLDFHAQNRTVFERSGWIYIAAASVIAPEFWHRLRQRLEQAERKGVQIVRVDQRMITVSIDRWVPIPSVVFALKPLLRKHGQLYREVDPRIPQALSEKCLSGSGWRKAGRRAGKDESLLRYHAARIRRNGGGE